MLDYPGHFLVVLTIIGNAILFLIAVCIVHSLSHSSFDSQLLVEMLANSPLEFQFHFQFHAIDVAYAKAFNC